VKRPSPGDPRPQRSVAGSRRWWVRYALAFVSAVLVVNAIAGERGYIELRRSERRHAEAQAALAARRAENASLQSAIHRLRSDPAAIEAAVREHLGYAKPGELVFTVREPRPRPIQEPAGPAAGAAVGAARAQGAAPAR
jgi:cell division protein FtsB